MAKDDIRKRGAVTEYRPDKDDISGGRDKSVQTEAWGAEGEENVSVTGSTSGGAAGRLEDLDDVGKPKE